MYRNTHVLASNSEETQNDDKVAKLITPGILVTQPAIAII